MTVTSTSTSNFSNLITTLVRKQAEENLRFSLPYANPANLYIPGTFQVGTNSITFPYYADITYTAASVTLTEGTAPTAVALAIDSEAYSAKQYGLTIDVSDLAIKQNPNEILAIASERAARHASVAIDTIVRGIVLAGSNVSYASGSARSLVSVAISASQLRKVYATMRKNAIPRFDDGFYHGIFTPEQTISMMSDTTKGAWLDAHIYTDARPLLAGEVGTYMGIRVIDATKQAQISTGTGSASADVHVGWVFGPQAYTIGDMQTLQAFFVPPGGDHTDPLAQKATVGWKWTGGAMLISKTGERCYRVESVETTL